MDDIKKEIYSVEELPGGLILTRPDGSREVYGDIRNQNSQSWVDPRLHAWSNLLKSVTKQFWLKVLVKDGSLDDRDQELFAELQEKGWQVTT